MAKYFKLIEIDRDKFVNAVGEDLDCCQVVVPINNALFVAVNEDEEYEINIPLEYFD